MYTSTEDIDGNPRNSMERKRNGDLKFYGDEFEFKKKKWRRFGY